jgi:hypothetical protein
MTEKVTNSERGPRGCVSWHIDGAGGGIDRSALRRATGPCVRLCGSLSIHGGQCGPADGRWLAWERGRHNMFLVTYVQKKGSRRISALSRRSVLLARLCHAWIDLLLDIRGIAGRADGGCQLASGSWYKGVEADIGGVYDRSNLFKLLAWNTGCIVIKAIILETKSSPNVG